nr:hypothetical protein [Cohnella lubricantis]
MRVDAFIQATVERGLDNNTQIAAALGVSVTQVWRAMLPVTDPRHNSPGTAYIAGVLTVFGGPFERFFFVESSLQACNKKSHVKGGE